MKNTEATNRSLISSHIREPSNFSIVFMSKMGVFLLLLLVLSNQLMVGFATNNGEDTDDVNVVSILAIDGGGIKGIIPGVILRYLEAALQKWNTSARIAEYFDAISGTSTGGIVTAILTAPDPQNKDRPLYPASEIVNFYKQHGPSIFSNSSCIDIIDPKFCPSPKYDGKYLREIVAQKLNGTLLNQTTTNVIIPSFDIKLLHPTIFSSLKLEKVPQLNVKLSDICIGTSAAPTVFPPYYFKHENTEFNLIDGAVVANIPARLAISEVLQQEKYKNRKILLLSIGTGIVKEEGRDANQTWNDLDWTKYISQFIGDASTTMSDYYVGSTFISLQAEENYLRIQEYNLDPTMNEMDNATKENMDKLERVGQNLLNEPVKRVDVNTFVPQETGEGTNAEVLDKLARILYEEWIRRHGKRALKVDNMVMEPLLNSVAKMLF